MKKVLLYSISLSVLLLLTTCSISYKFDGASINYDLVKTITIKDFANRAPLVYPPLTAAFDRAIRDKYINQTRLKSVANNADIELEGEITNYNVTNTAVKSDGFASRAKLTVTVQVRYTNRKNPKEDVDQSFTSFQEYDASQTLDQVQDALITYLVEDLVDQIFNATVANW